VNLNRSLAGSKKHEEVPNENGSATQMGGKSLTYRRRLFRIRGL